jgi:hypothetical protein
MNRWDDLSLQEKNQLLGIYASKGYTDLASIISHYNTFQAGGYVNEKDPVLKDRKPKANFYQRLLDANRQTIPNWENRINNQNNVTTHKMSWATDDDGTAIVYPEVQEINGKLYDFTDPRNKEGKWAAYDRAVQTGDTIQMTPEQANFWTQHYKEFYPFNYADGGSLGKVTPYGQWQYPHQVTTIPGNNITMRGVNYPVIGVSNTGDTKYMLPNIDYLFDGQYVTEYPVKRK